jgi:hypothetical protein
MSRSSNGLLTAHEIWLAQEEARRLHTLVRKLLQVGRKGALRESTHCPPCGMCRWCAKATVCWTPSDIKLTLGKREAGLTWDSGTARTMLIKPHWGKMKWEHKAHAAAHSATVEELTYLCAYFSLWRTFDPPYSGDLYAQVLLITGRKSGEKLFIMNTCIFLAIIT